MKLTNSNDRIEVASQLGDQLPDETSRHEAPKPEVSLDPLWLDQVCTSDTPDCPPRFLRIGDLAARTGESQSRIRKWTGQGLIPHFRKHGEHTMYPEEAVNVVRGIRQSTYQPAVETAG